MSYSIQLLTEAVQGKHNIQYWVLEAIETIDKEDIELLHKRALTFIDLQHEDKSAYARISELHYHFDTKEAIADAIVTALLEAVIAIKPEFKIRGGREVAFPGVAPIQAIATQVGLHLHKDQLDAVETGIDLIAEFQDIGMYELYFGEDEHGRDTCVVKSNFSDVEELHSRIKATKYLPPMLVAPLPVRR
jgi:hypothetical protein